MLCASENEDKSKTHLHAAPNSLLMDGIFFLVKMTEIPNESGQGPELDGCAESWMRFRSNSWEIFQRMGRAMGTTKKPKGFRLRNATVSFTRCQPIYTKFGTLMDTDVLHVLVKFECYTPLRCGAVNF